MDQTGRAFSPASFDPIVHWARLLCDDKYAHDDVSNEYKHTYTNIQSLWINTRRRRLSTFEQIIVDDQFWQQDVQ